MTGAPTHRRRRRVTGLAACLATLAGSLAGLGTMRTAQAFGPTVATRSPTDIVVGSDGKLWFAEQDAQAIGRMAPDGTGFTEFPVATSDFVGIEGLARGSDGNVWFTAQSPFVQSAVGRVTPAGKVTLFLLPGNNGSTIPYQIAAGPDGNLWFPVFHNTAPSAFDIDRITPTGVLTEFPVPAFGGEFISAGPDGAMWSAGHSFDTASIGRIATDGKVTTFPVGTNRLLGPITTGSDGNLWFQDYNGQTQTSTLDRMTVTGVDTTFPVVGNDAMARITSGSDGNLWYTTSLNESVVRQAPAGVTQTFTLPSSPSFPYGVVTGPDGRMWITEYDGNRLGALTVGGTLTEYTLPPVAPSVRYVFPQGGPTAGGTAVGINGAGFIGATAVLFGGVRASSFVVQDDHTLSAVAPPHAAGTVDVTVTTPVGTSKVNRHDAFIYEAPATVKLVAPDAGTTAGGTTVLIAGSHFSGAVDVWFGVQSATSFQVLSDQLIEAVSPPALAGTVDVRVIKQWAGASAITAQDRFHYLL